MPNLYEYFVAQGLNLVAVGGFVGLIVPDRLGFNRQFVSLRGRILRETQMKSLIYRAPFPGVTADTLMFVVERTDRIDATVPVVVGEHNRELLGIPQGDFGKSQDYAFQCYESVETMEVITKLEDSPKVNPLGAFCKTTSGFGGKSDLITDAQQRSSQIEILKGDSIARYSLRKKYWFDFKKQNITGRTTNTAKLGVKPKILLRKTGDRIIGTLEETGVFPEQSLYFLFDNESSLDFRYLLGFLNSSLATFYYRNRLITNRRSIAQIKKVHLDAFRVRTIDFSNPNDKACHNRMVELVETMLKLHKQIAAAKTSHEKTAIQRQIDATDKQIDQLVYELYDLTEEEIKIVEEASQ